MAGEDRQSDMVSYPDFIPPVVDNPRDAVAMTSDLYAPQLADEEHDVASAETSERQGIEQQLQQRQTIRVDAPDQGCQPEEERLPDEARLAARLAELQEELRRQSELLAWRSSSLASLRKIRDDVMVERYLAMKALAAFVKKKKHLQLQARLWRGTIAVRKQSIFALRKEKYWAKRDKQWWAKRLKLLVGELAPLQRERAALEKKEKEQTDSIHAWFDNLPQEEASFSRWYEEEMKAVADSMTPAPSLTHARTVGP